MHSSFVTWSAPGFAVANSNALRFVSLSGPATTAARQLSKTIFMQCNKANFTTYILHGMLIAHSLCTSFQTFCPTCSALCHVVSGLIRVTCSCRRASNVASVHVTPIHHSHGSGANLLHGPSHLDDGLRMAERCHETTGQARKIKPNCETELVHGRKATAKTIPCSPL